MAVDYLERLPKPNKADVNLGLSSPGPAFMVNLLGHPRDTYTGKCQPPTNPQFIARLEKRSVGPLKSVQGLKPALASLERVFADVKKELPDLHALIGTAGMLCCRKVKLPGGKLGKNPSNHSFGAAIDITIGGVLDDQGDNKTQRGLLILSKYFHTHGWNWGVTFPNEDSMHFEVARETLQKWRKDGLI